MQNTKKTKRDVPEFQLGDIVKVKGTWEVVAVVRTVGGGVVYELMHAIEPEGIFKIREKLITKVKGKSVFEKERKSRNNR